jgi:hypothetical protein
VTTGCLSWAAAYAAAPLPGDTIWLACNGYGARIVNHTETETTPDTNAASIVYAASVSAKSLWWYSEPDRMLVAFDTADVTPDAIIGTQHHTRPNYTMTGTVSITPKALTYESHGDAAYPNGSHQVARTNGTCTKIAPKPVG